MNLSVSYLILGLSLMLAAWFLSMAITLFRAKTITHVELTRGMIYDRRNRRLQISRRLTRETFEKIFKS